MFYVLQYVACNMREPMLKYGIGIILHVTYVNTRGYGDVEMVNVI